MSVTVQKYRLSITHEDSIQSIELRGIPLSVHFEIGNKLVLSAMHDTAAAPLTHDFVVVETGKPLPPGFKTGSQFIGSISTMLDAPFYAQVFTRVQP